MSESDMILHVQLFIAEALRIIKSFWRQIRRYLLFIRKHGTQREKRAAWKLLHTPRRRPVKRRRVA